MNRKSDNSIYQGRFQNSLYCGRQNKIISAQRELCGSHTSPDAVRLFLSAIISFSLKPPHFVWTFCKNSAMLCSFHFSTLLPSPNALNALVQQLQTFCWRGLGWGLEGGREEGRGGVEKQTKNNHATSSNL